MTRDRGQDTPKKPASKAAKARARRPKKKRARKRRGYQPRRPSAKQRTRALRVVQKLKAAYPIADCALDHRNAYELTAATILSAQCTDVRVNQVTPELFQRWPRPQDLAAAPLEEIETVIRSTGFFRNKARNLQGMAARVVDAYAGDVPREMADLLTLPGVARKTANVVRGVMWGLADGIVVDTHVARLSKRLGWTRVASPVHIERDLMVLHPQEEWIALSHRLILHGRQICVARKPRCDECTLRPDCPSAPI